MVHDDNEIYSWLLWRILPITEMFFLHYMLISPISRRQIEKGILWYVPVTQLKVFFFFMKHMYKSCLFGGYTLYILTTLKADRVWLIQNLP